MAIIHSRSGIVNLNTTPIQRCTVALDITSGVYKIQIDGNDATASGSQPAQTDRVQFTAGGNTYIIPALALGAVGFAGAAGISPDAAADQLSALGRVAAVALAAGASASSVFGVGGAYPG